MNYVLATICRIARGMGNPRVNVTGCPGVRVRVAKIVPPKNPYPSHGYDGFDPNSNSARKRDRLPAQQLRLCISAHHNHQPPRKHEQDSKGGGIGGASTHFPSRYVIYSQFIRPIQIFTVSICSLPPTTLENECAGSFLMVVGCPSPSPSHHPRK